jgi:hypothetical protein
MFRALDEQISYIVENYSEVTDKRIDDSHWDLYCQTCKIVRGFKVTRHDLDRTNHNYFPAVTWSKPHVFHFECPVCKTYKAWIAFVFQFTKENTGERYCRYFKVTSIPNEGIEDIDELPEEPKELRTAYRQAIRSMDAGAYIAAAAMFRRAVQVITRKILQVKPGTLDKELKSSVGREYNGITLKQDFSDTGYIIKEAGNQSAHPDEDPDLLDFTEQDANDLQSIFMELVNDLFVTPEAIRRSKEDFLRRRKIRSVI